MTPDALPFPLPEHRHRNHWDRMLCGRIIYGVRLTESGCWEWEGKHNTAGYGRGRKGSGRRKTRAKYMTAEEPSGTQR